MGMFDSLYADCPTCGEKIEFQSKADECDLASFTIDNALRLVLLDVLNDPERCRKCGNWAALYDPNYPPDVEWPKPHPKMRKVRMAKDPGVSGSYQWWTEPFTENDLIE